MNDLDRYTEACNYPGRLDSEAVERHLLAYCKALGVERRVVQLKRGWTLDEYPELNRTIDEVLADFANRVGGVKHDPTVTPEEQRAAKHRFAAWCVSRRWWHEDISWGAVTFFGAKPGSKELAWAKPYLEAFIAGAWSVYWTADVLYWVAKPRVYLDERRRLHREDGPACDSDIEPLYFLEGTLLHEHVVLRPETITVGEIRAETNLEAKRIMRERYGMSCYLRDTGAKLIDADYEGATEGAAPRALLEDEDGSRWLIGTDGSSKRVYEMGPFDKKVKTCVQAHNQIACFDERKIKAKS